MTQYHLTTREELVEWAANLPANKWRRLANHVSWVHRRGDAVPEQLADVSEYVMDTEAWEQVRGEVNKRRARKARAIKAARDELYVKRRRNYMRAYMAQRRNNHGTV